MQKEYLGNKISLKTIVRYGNGHILKHGGFQWLIVIISLEIVGSNSKFIEHNIQSPPHYLTVLIFPSASYKNPTNCWAPNTPPCLSDFVYTEYLISPSPFDKSYFSYIILFKYHLLCEALPKFPSVSRKKVPHLFRQALIKAHVMWCSWISCVCIFLTGLSVDGGTRVFASRSVAGM